MCFQFSQQRQVIKLVYPIFSQFQSFSLALPKIFSPHAVLFTCVPSKSQRKQQHQQQKKETPQASLTLTSTLIPKNLEDFVSLLSLIPHFLVLYSVLSSLRLAPRSRFSLLAFFLLFFKRAKIVSKQDLAENNFPLPNRFSCYYLYYFIFNSYIG